MELSIEASVYWSLLRDDVLLEAVGSLSKHTLIRAATLTDAPSMAEKSHDGGASSSAVPGYVGAMKDPDRLVLVAEASGQVVGWAKTHVWDHADGPALAGHYLGGVTVDPRWRRQGIAARLTQERLDWIWTRNHEAWCVVNAENIASIELHRAVGFVQVAAGARFHTTIFAGGRGLLLRAERPIETPNH